MICKNCGTNCSNDDVFCGNCGNKLERDNVQAIVLQNASQDTAAFSGIPDSQPEDTSSTSMYKASFYLLYSQFAFASVVYFISLLLGEENEIASTALCAIWILLSNLISIISIILGACSKKKDASLPMIGNCIFMGSMWFFILVSCILL